MRTPRHGILPAALLALASGCGLSNQFYAELEEPGICKTVSDATMTATTPGADLVLTIPIDLATNLPLFDARSGNLTLRLLSVTFLGKSGIQDFNSVDSASISAVPDPASGLSLTEVIRYDRAPGFVPGLELTVGGDSSVDLVPFLDTNGVVTVEARMVGGLPNNSWVADITGCLYTKVRVNYLDAYGVHV